MLYVHPLKCKVSISKSSLALAKVIPTDLPNKISWGTHLPSAGPLSWEAQWGAWTPHLWEESLQ